VIPAGLLQSANMSAQTEWRPQLLHNMADKETVSLVRPFEPTADGSMVKTPKGIIGEKGQTYSVQ
jgi:hypothetical protein